MTIHIDDATEPVAAVPLQAVVGGAESGPKRFVYLMTPTGPVEREVKLGKFNDAMIEVLSGVGEGDDVVVNPKAVVGDKLKTREEGGDGAPRGSKRGGEGGGEGGGKKGGGEGGGKKKGGGPPKGDGPQA